MCSDRKRFAEAIRRIDEANRQDPNKETSEGEEHTKELLYARRMTRWLEKLDPEASEALRLAARSQHIRRWEIPRDRFPMDRRGYHLWRTSLYDFHAEKAGEILRDVGYDDELIARVQSLLRKEKLKSNSEAQALEDVICLVFLEDYFADFSRKHEEAKLITILKRTWKKMSPRGHEAALKLDLGPQERALIEKALAT